ncbi:MAG: hypothetical protein JJU42_10955 [Rhodobacteraceae bacterium]|nr:hypothetical protein [Paracoccaceae bacterium]
MAILGFALHLLAALGVLGLAAKYAFGPVPADYHAAIFDRGGVTAPAPVLRVLRAVYLALAGMLVAVATGIAALSFGVWRGVGDPVTLGALAIMALAAGGVSALATLAVERETGVRTPWRPALGLVVLVLAGAVLML